MFEPLPLTVGELRATLGLYPLDDGIEEFSLSSICQPIGYYVLEPDDEVKDFSLGFILHINANGAPSGPWSIVTPEQLARAVQCFTALNLPEFTEPKGYPPNSSLF